MPSLTLSTSFDVNSGLVLSPEEIRQSYLFGVTINDQNGVSISDSVFEFYIRSAQKEMERYLSVKLTRQIYREEKTFTLDDWWRWGFIKTTYPVVCPLQMDGFLNATQQVNYPIEWITSKRTSDQDLYHRSLYLVPVSSNSAQFKLSAVYSGILPQIHYHSQRMIPYYWAISYVTGFSKVPEEIINAIGKLASINLFHIAGDLILGTAGIAAQSIGIDGLSQSISTTSSATNAGYGARILGYLNDLKRDLPNMKNYYGGINWTVA